MALFQQRTFISASGLPLSWRIECDALTDEDWATIAFVCAPRLPPFSEVIGVPRGGLALANHMRRYSDPSGFQLVVDDVWTTGKSMMAAAPDGKWIGFVAFARPSPLPDHVFYFMRSLF